MDTENMQPNALPPHTSEPKSPFPLTPSKSSKLPPLQTTPSLPADESSSGAIVVGESYSLQVSHFQI